MLKIDTDFDAIIGAKYDLYKTTLNDLAVTAKSWYGDLDISEFDERNKNGHDFEINAREMKLSGVVSNMFFAYHEEGKIFLLDGYNRLFTDYGKFNKDTVVYLKTITDKLQDHKLMRLMYRLNMWKLYESRISYGFSINDFLDRGFRLFLYTKFGINIYSYGEHYDKRLRHECDINVLDSYFINENESSGDFKTSYVGVSYLMGNPNIINDLKSIIIGNDYLTQPFNNYGLFLRGYAKFLAYLRYKGDNREYSVKFFLDKLFEDKKFFNKLQKMSGNEATRKNIYHFFRDLESKL